MFWDATLYPHCTCYGGPSTSVSSSQFHELSFFLRLRFHLPTSSTYQEIHLPYGVCERDSLWLLLTGPYSWTHALALGISTGSLASFERFTVSSVKPGKAKNLSLCSGIVPSEVSITDSLILFSPCKG